MKTLCLLRHAHAGVGTATLALEDHERMLSEQGRREAEAVGQFLHEQNLHPDFILSSSSVRTIQTVRYLMAPLMKEEGTRVSSNFEKHLYLAPADTLMNEIPKIDDSFNHLLYVGHNPGIAELAVRLGGKKISDQVLDFPTGTLVIFKCNIDTWSAFAPDMLRFEKVYIPAAA